MTLWLMSPNFNGHRMTKPALVVITGPTASGKTTFALEIAKEYNGEIVCADSRTVYKGMDIGTAKPTIQEQASVPHHLLDVVEPSQIFTASQFKDMANQAIVDIAQRGKLPILVGGTGLYVDAVIFDYQFGEPADPQRREFLMGKSIEELQHICKENNITLPFNSKNKRHLIRAIELNGLPTAKRELRKNTIVVAISTETDVLLQKIHKRVVEMFKDGVVQEEQKLGEKYGWGTEAMTANIYRFCHEILIGHISEVEAIDLVVKSDKSLVKRQLTWLKRNPYIRWGTPNELRSLIAEFLM